MSAPASTPPLRSLLPLVALALLLRLGAVAWSAVDHPEHFRPETERIEAELNDPAQPFVHPLGFEVSNVAWSLACAGNGFDDPFGGRTGPTGWVSPGIAGVWAAVFAATGCFTPASVLALLAVAAVGSVAMVLLAAGAGARLAGDRRAGWIAALLAACSPWDILLFQAASLMDLNLYALGLLALIGLLAALWRRPSPGRLLGFSAASAVATLCNPALFFAAVAGFVFLLVRLPASHPVPPSARLPRPLSALAALALFVAVHLVVVGPWILYQHRAVGGWFFVKSNAPFEIALGNRPGVDGILRAETFERMHPSRDVTEYRRYRRLGELAYVEQHFDRFLRDFEPSAFARATGRRFVRLFFRHVAQPWQSPAGVWAHHVLAALPGLVLLLTPIVRRLVGRRLDGGDALVYLATAGYAAPFLVAGVMERYTLALSVPVVLLGARIATDLLACRDRPGGRSRPGRGSGASADRTGDRPAAATGTEPAPDAPGP